MCLQKKFALHFVSMRVLGLMLFQFSQYEKVTPLDSILCAGLNPSIHTLS